RENPWAFWKKSWWTYAHWARRDSELQKVLARTYGLLHEVLRWHSLDERPGDRALEYAGAHGIERADRKRIQYLLGDDPSTLTLDAALELFDALDRIMIEIGDAQHVCAEIETELQWAKGSTTWLTWDAMYGRSIPDAVEAYRAGRIVSGDELDAARRRLFSFRVARSEDYQVHRARQKMRAKNLRVLAALLFPLVVTVAWLLGAKDGGSPWEVSLVATLGALGSVMSGTIKARDKLVRGSDLRAFRAGLLAQVFLGAASSLVLLLLLASDILQVAGAGSPEGRAAVGFVAGFSEPFFLGTVARVARMGEESGEESEKPAPHAHARRRETGR
ncbi:MAG TPA: hypothetical protein VFJ02_08145, partial [Vicinamibacterales bacterium]|nr:hypothetical protein [Vicinamibacterales bacterium]